MARWLFAVGCEWVMIAALLWAASRSVWAWPFVVLALGTRQHALAILGHDGSHYLVCRGNPRLNDWLTCLLTFWPLSAGLRGYRIFHFAHHRCVGTPNDPELDHRERLSRWQWRSPSSRLRVAGLVFMDLCGFGFVEVAKVFYTIPRRGISDYVGPAAFAVLFAVVCWHYPICLLWYVALGTSFWAAFRLRMWTEHIGAKEGTHKITAKWWQRAIYLPHNTWLHYEHHDSPHVPFWRLPELRRGVILLPGPVAED